MCVAACWTAPLDRPHLNVQHVVSDHLPRRPLVRIAEDLDGSVILGVAELLPEDRVVVLRALQEEVGRLGDDDADLRQQPAKEVTSVSLISR